MSTNLTEYELLQHRHLSLLKALQDADVIVYQLDGKWNVGAGRPSEKSVADCKLRFKMTVDEARSLADRIDQVRQDSIARGPRDPGTPEAMLDEWLWERVRLTTPEQQIDLADWSRPWIGDEPARPAPKPLPLAFSLGYSGNCVSLVWTELTGIDRRVDWHKPSPEVTKLLAALVDAIVHPSPAKVD